MRNESFGQGAGAGSGVQYRYAGTKDTGGRTKYHVVEAVHPQHGVVGSLTWTSKEVHALDVGFDHRRQGIATGLWNHANNIADGRRIPTPKHSSQRTTMGDAWARSVGGRLPRLDRR